jgi:hypothetical protein
MQFMLNVYFVIQCIFRYTHAGSILYVQDRSCTYRIVPGLPFIAVGGHNCVVLQVSLLASTTKPG